MNTSTFFKQKLGASDDEVLVLKRLLSQTLEESSEVYKKKFKESNLWYHLQHPYHFGFFAREVLTHEAISDEVKSKINHHILQINLELEDGQQPGPGLFQYINWLYHHETIKRVDYLGARKGIIWLPRMGDNYIEDHEDIISACKGIFNKIDLTDEEILEFMLMVLTAKKAIGSQGSIVLDFLMSTPAVTNEVKKQTSKIIVNHAIPFARGAYQHPLDITPEEKDRLSIRFLSGNIRRSGVVWYNQFKEDTEELLEYAIDPDTVRDYGGDHVANGGLDLLDQKWDKISSPKKESLLTAGTNLPDTSVRRKAYTLGKNKKGIDFLKNALDDKAKSIRQWARKKMEKES